jgi:DNA gyrase subunit B
LHAGLQDPLLPNQVDVVAEFHQSAEKYRLIVRRKHHGNVRVTVLDYDFVRGADYAVLARAAATFQGLIGKGAMVSRGEGEKRKEAMVADFREAMQWLRAEADRNVSKQRYKGLGEMNPSQLWETTMDPKVRRLLRVQIEDAIAADEIFTTLMGDNVEPRRAFIETHALQAANLDV